MSFKNAEYVFIYALVRTYNFQSLFSIVKRHQEASVVSSKCQLQFRL